MDATEENFAAREDVDKDIDIIKVLVDKKDQFTRRSVVDRVLEKFETNFYVFLYLGHQKQQASKLSLVVDSVMDHNLWYAGIINL